MIFRVSVLILFVASRAWSFDHDQLFMWPESTPASEVVKMVRELARDDDQVMQVFAQADASLRAKGYDGIESITTYCPNQATSAQDAGVAFFKIESRIEETRIQIDSDHFTLFSEPAGIIKANYFNQKLVPTPGAESLLVNSDPNICLRRTGKLIHAYNGLIHEVFHLVFLDHLQELQKSVEAPDELNYFENALVVKGGEFDANEFATGAEVRLFKKLGLISTSSAFAFFNSEGELINRADFENQIRELYRSYYDNEQVKVFYLNSRIQFVRWRIQVLEDSVIPYFQKSELLAIDSKKYDSIRAELNRLQQLLVTLSDQSGE